MSKFIRTSKLSLKFSNKHKLEELKSFIIEYKRVANLYLNQIWDNSFSHSYPKKNKIVTKHFNANNLLELPNRLSTVKINRQTDLETTLTSRSLQCCLNQTLAIIRGDVEKQKKRLFVFNKLRAQSKKIPRKLKKAVRNNHVVKPDLSNLKPELNINCIDFQETNSVFDAFIKLKCFTTKVKNKSIKFPVKYHKHFNKWNSQGKKLNSFLIDFNSIDVRFEVNRTVKTKGRKVGADQGLNSVLTLSDRQSPPITDKHNHSLKIITQKLSRKRKGSMAFSKAQKHRTNFVNWSINQLNLSNISEIRLEKVKYLRYKKRSSRYLSHWTYTDISDKLKRLCEEKEVLLTLQSSVYKSQRCNECGLVLKSQRKGKKYSCKNCGLEIDADFNSSLNHQQDLPDIPYDLRRLNLNRKGFFWKSDGFYSLTGEKLIVSLPKKVS